MIQLIVLGLGAYLILIGHFTVGSLFAFLGLLGSVPAPWSPFTQLLQRLQQATGSMQRVAQVIDERVEVEDDHGRGRAPAAAPGAALRERRVQLHG